MFVTDCLSTNTKASALDLAAHNALWVLRFSPESSFTQTAPACLLFIASCRLQMRQLWEIIIILFISSVKIVKKINFTISAVI